MAIKAGDNARMSVRARALLALSRVAQVTSLDISQMTSVHAGCNLKD